MTQLSSDVALRPPHKPPISGKGSVGSHERLWVPGCSLLPSLAGLSCPPQLLLSTLTPASPRQRPPSWALPQAHVVSCLLPSQRFQGSGPPWLVGQRGVGGHREFLGSCKQSPAQGW